MKKCFKWMFFENYWRTGLCGGAAGIILSIGLLLFHREGLLLYASDNLLSHLLFPFLKTYNSIFLRSLNALDFITKEHFSNQSAVSYLTMLPFWFFLCGFILAFVSACCRDVLRVLRGTPVQRAASRSAIRDIVNGAFLYSVSMLVVFASVRKMHNHDAFWIWWPGSQWYTLLGIGGAIAVILSFIFTWLPKKRQPLGILSWMTTFLQTVLLGLTIYLIIPPSEKAVCRQNLVHLSTAILNGDFPESFRWSDELEQVLKQRGVEHSEKCFICPSQSPQRNGKQCSYSLNRSAVFSKQPDVVLLYESSGGWNNAAEKAEIDVTRHGKGCWVVFRNHDVQFIEADQVRLLKWQDED